VRWWNACAYYAISLAQSQLKLGYQVYLAGDPDYLATQHAKEAGLQVFEISFATKNPFKWWLEKKKLTHFIRSKKIHLVNAHRPEDHLMSSLVTRDQRIPLIRTVGDVRPPKKNFLNKALHLRGTDYFIFSSQANLVRYISRWPQLERIAKVIYGGIDIDQFQPIDKNVILLNQLELKIDQIVIGLIGRLSEVKDHHTFIKSASLVLDYYPDVHFIISGIDAELSKAELAKYAANLNIENHITFLDYYQPITELISILDIAVIASKGSEAICRVAFEYMAMGKPIIATDVNVLPEIIVDARNGFIVASENAYEMAQAIMQLINNRSLRQKISGQNVMDCRRRFDLQVAAQETDEVYRFLLESSDK
jgi:glycosyltransferase involved in cell wall biosynthesis